MIYGYDGKIQGSKEAIYTSPRAVDPNEGDTIEMIPDIKGYGFLDITQNENNTFTLKVKKAFI